MDKSEYLTHSLTETKIPNEDPLSRNSSSDIYRFERKNLLCEKEEYRISSSDEDNKMIKIIVEDSGVGIKNEDISKLFVPFGKLDNNKINPSGSYFLA